MKLINKLKYYKNEIPRKLVDLISYGIVNGHLRFLRLFSPYIIGSFFGFLHIFILKKQLKNEKSKNVLCFDRFVFARDLEALRENGKHNYIVFNSCNLAKILSLYVPKWMQQQILFHKLITLEEHKDLLKKITLFANGFITFLKKKINIDVILFAGIDYYGDYPFHLIAREKNMPFMALFYEHYTIPHFQESTINLYKDFKFSFSGNAIACFGEKTARVFRESHVISPEKIFITGAPRYDKLLLNNECSSTKKNSIILFSYPGVEYGAPLNFSYVLIEFAKYSAKYQNVTYIVKCKDTNHFNQVTTILDGLAHNLDIHISTPNEILLKSARAVFSFNSLTCIESLLSKAHVYIPYFADAKLPDSYLQLPPCYLSSDISGLFFLNSPSEVEKALHEISTNYSSENMDSDQRKDFFSEFFEVSKNETSVEKIDNIIDSLYC